jgi:hypothetical protein
LNTKRYRLLIALSLVLLLLAGFWSCRRPKTAADRGIGNAVSQEQTDEALGNAVDSLNTLEEFTSIDSVPELLQRFGPNYQPKADEPIDPLLAAWPQPEMFRDVVSQFQQWVRAQQPPSDWKLDPMTAALPKALQELPQVKNLAKMEFTRFDGFALQEAAWLRAVSLSARGDVVDDLDRARNLFDWTVRNIQLEPDRLNRIPQLPRETLLFGRGTPTERAWVFILLLRQLDIDAAILGVVPEAGLGTSVPSAKPSSKSDSKPGSKPHPAASSSDKKPAPAPRAWCVGVLIEGEVYLFDPVLGLPIPGPDGITREESGQLAIRPATLAQVAADAKLLHRLDFDAAHPYRVTSVDPKQVTAMLEASPQYLSRTMKAIELHLTGSQRKMVLTTSPTAQAEHWKAAHVAKSQLWLLPFETIQERSQMDWRASAAWLNTRLLPLFWVYQEQTAGGVKTSMDPLEYEEARQAKAPQVVTHIAPLYKGRISYFKGKFGEDGAAGWYKIARPSHESLARSSESDFEKSVKFRAKQDATYWFGLMAYQRGHYSSAVDWLQAKTIETYPNGPWIPGARYNLGRAYEASSDRDMAMLLYHSNVSSPGYGGDLLRAKWLRELGEKRKPAGE